MAAALAVSMIRAAKRSDGIEGREFYPLDLTTGITIYIITGVANPAKADDSPTGRGKIDDNVT